MTWRLHDGAREAEAQEEEVLAAIRAGTLPASAAIRRLDEPEWRSLRTHAPFAMALDATTRAVAAPQLAPSDAKPNFNGLAQACAAGAALLTIITIGIRCLVGEPTASRSAGASTWAPLPPPPAAPAHPQAQPRQAYEHPSPGGSGELDCHHEMTVAPLLPTESKFKAWTNAGANNSDLIFKFNGKLVDRGTLAKVVEYTGETWIRIQIANGPHAGAEGYTFVTCVNK